MESKGGKKKSSSLYSTKLPLVTPLKTFDLTEESRNSDQLLTPTTLQKQSFTSSLQAKMELPVSAIGSLEVSFFLGAQPAPHRHFSEEVAVLEAAILQAWCRQQCICDGQCDKQQNWHVYSASAEFADVNNHFANSTSHLRMDLAMQVLKQWGYDFRNAADCKADREGLVLSDLAEFSVALHCDTPGKELHTESGLTHYRHVSEKGLLKCR
ncbi:hypothetical protein HAX54_051555 [Datura stramonium]|uniref:Uncharacterized protein n=1 Tax=Datura stramonium TaxID=4076 RepID=A0ABS8SZW6_DATST|nr:hypothetical protein [Datura stramonium]